MKIRVGPGIWLLVGGLICIVVLVLGLFVIDFPQKSKVGNIDRDITDVESSIQQERNRLNQLKQYEKDPDQFKRQIDVLKERVPDTVELSDIIQQIDHSAEEAGLDFFSFTPKVPVKADSYYVVSCEAVFNGRYFNIVEFFNHIERLPRTVKVVSLELIAVDTGLPYLQMTIKLEAYFTTNQGISQIVGE
jgi:Tfp pilus assembly protein PilO